MYPWLWYWAPQIHFPWSGSVAQNIEPNTSWFSDMIPPGAGDAAIEQQAFGVASYGTQLGLITKLLLDLARNAELPDEAAKAMRELQRISARIDAIKGDARRSAAERIEDEVRSMQDRGGPEFEALKRGLLRLLRDPAALGNSVGP